MTEFEQLLHENQLGVKRFVKFKISNIQDTEDILQEVFLVAYQNFGQLKCKDSFKSWIIGIARNKCNDYFRRTAKLYEIPIDEITEKELVQTRFGYAENDLIGDALETLHDKDKQILYLTYWKQLPQSEIAKQLKIPLGTVKSRLYTAKQHFKAKYPSVNIARKDDKVMTKLPKTLPAYTIQAVPASPFAVRCEELQGLSIIPKLGEKVVWGLYDFASKRCEEYSEVSVTGKAEVHGIEGVEIVSVQHDLKNDRVHERQFIAQLTDTHCRYLAESHQESDIKKCITFLDGEIFMKNWGFGEDNCGNEIALQPKNHIQRNGNEINKKAEKEIADVVGRYTVEINGKSYDTICVMEVGHFDNAIAIEQYIDQNGRTVLWRRFNRNDWAIARYKRTWSERLPNNEKLIVNDQTFVHWYDCITDYII